MIEVNDNVTRQFLIEEGEISNVADKYEDLLEVDRLIDILEQADNPTLKNYDEVVIRMRYKELWKLIMWMKELDNVLYDRYNEEWEKHLVSVEEECEDECECNCNDSDYNYEYECKNINGQDEKITKMTYSCCGR